MAVEMLGETGLCGRMLKMFALCGGRMKNPVSNVTHFPDVPCKKQSYRHRVV